MGRFKIKKRILKASDVDAFRQMIFLLPKAPSDSRIHQMMAAMEVGGGQAWSPEEAGARRSLIPEARGVVPGFFALENKYLSV